MSRIHVNNEIDFSEVERILDENGYDYDYDGGNRQKIEDVLQRPVQYVQHPEAQRRHSNRQGQKLLRAVDAEPPLQISVGCKAGHEPFQRRNA